MTEEPQVHRPMGLALAVTAYLTTHERLRFPWQHVKRIYAEFSNAQAVTPGQGQTVTVAGVKVGEIGGVRLENGLAVLELFRGRSLRPSGAGERTTPTGAALLSAWTEPADSLPELAIDAIGYGAGTKRWEDAPNLLRAVLGERVRGQPGGGAGWVLEANLDDLSPQLVAAALEAALAAGAADAWIAPVTMKKGRPGHLLGAVVADAARSAVEEVLFRETSTLGIRATRGSGRRSVESWSRCRRSTASSG